MGSIGAVGTIPNYDIAQKVLVALGSPKLSSKLKNNQYEVVGYAPYGLAYFITKDRNINSLESMSGKRLGVLDNIDPSHARMARKLGLIPVTMSYDTAAGQFSRGDFDILPVSLLVYQPFEVDKIIGAQGGILEYPIVFMTANFILRNGNYQDGFAQKSRQWFSQKSKQMFKVIERIENSKFSLKSKQVFTAETY